MSIASGRTPPDGNPTKANPTILLERPQQEGETGRHKLGHDVWEII